MIIRSIQLGDNAILSKLIKTVFEEFKIDQPGTVYTDPTTDHLFELFNISKAACWVAEDDGELVGLCGVYPTKGLPDGYAELVKFYLSASARGKGIGKALMERTFLSAVEIGYEHLYLESFPELSKAVGMYQKAGFQFIDKPMGNSGHFACTIWMVKHL